MHAQALTPLCQRKEYQVPHWKRGLYPPGMNALRVDRGDFEKDKYNVYILLKIRNQK